MVSLNKAYDNLKNKQQNKQIKSKLRKIIEMTRKAL